MISDRLFLHSTAPGKAAMRMLLERVLRPLSAALMMLALPGLVQASDTVITLEGGMSATLNMPEHSAPVPAVLMLHGFASSKDEVGGMYKRAADALAEKGIASLRIDFAGFGKSDGDTGSTTVSAQLEQARQALTALKATDGVDPARLGVLGFSLGGGVAHAFGV